MAPGDRASFATACAQAMYARDYEPSDVLIKVRLRLYIHAMTKHQQS